MNSKLINVAAVAGLLFLPAKAIADDRAGAAIAGAALGRSLHHRSPLNNSNRPESTSTETVSDHARTNIMETLRLASVLATARMDRESCLVNTVSRAITTTW